MRVTGPGDFFLKPFFVQESLGSTREKERKGEGMSKMMDRWLQKAKEGDKGLTRPPASSCVSQHKNEVRSGARGFFQSQFRVSAYKSVGRPRHDSQKREDTVEKVTNVFMEQYTDYTKDYPQEDVLRGLEETVQTVEATFHAGYVWTVWVDLVCD